MRGSSSRALALDALRGLSVFLMILSSSIPFGVLPDWMYHAQVPPPDHRFIPTLPGITWVDLVFPFFLFSMGAAIPFALSRRLEQGMPRWRAVLGILERGFLLAAFAIYDEHIRPWRMNGGFENMPVWIEWVGLLGFALLIPMFVQLPRDWNSWVKVLVRAGGWAGAALFMYLIRYPDGSGFSLYRSDIIILVLANMAVFAALVWLVTRFHVVVRIGVLGILIALRVSSGVDGWIHTAWQMSPAPWLFRFDFLKYLFIVIPGTIVGDLVLSWMKSGPQDEKEGPGWPAFRFVLICGLMILLNVILVSGLKARWIVETTACGVALASGGLALFLKPVTKLERLMQTLYWWAVYFLVVGLFFEPFEGGIKKDPSTLSYYFLTTGLAIGTLIFFMVVIDVFRGKRWVNLFIESGQNPLVAYAGINNLIRPLLGLTGLGALLDMAFVTPWLGVIKGFFVTTLVSFSASLFTKAKVFLRT